MEFKKFLYVLGPMYTLVQGCLLVLQKQVVISLWEGLICIIILMSIHYGIFKILMSKLFKILIYILIYLFINKIKKKKIFERLYYKWNHVCYVVDTKSFLKVYLNGDL